MTDAYLNGEFLPLEQCKIPVMDRGFIFGDSVYELIPVYSRNPFRIRQHIARLQRSLEQVQIADPYGMTSWLELIQEMIARVESQDSYVYIQVTRGVAPRDHAYPVNCEPTVFAMARPLPVIEPLTLKQGLRAKRVKDIRWDRCDIKVTSLLANVMLKQSAISEGCHEAIFVRDGKILEGSASNIFIVMNDAVYTAPKDHLILPGITRDFIVELLRELDIPLTEAALQESSREHFQEIWMTSSTKEVLPITLLDNEKVGTGRPGPLWERVYTAFQSRKAAYGREVRV